MTSLPHNLQLKVKVGNECQGNNQGNNQESENNMEQRATSTLLSQLDNGFLCENFPFCKTFKKKFNTSLMNLFGCGHLSYKR